MTAEDYVAGDVKQDPDTQAVAVRTVFPHGTPGLEDRQWGVMTVSNGGHYCTFEKVADWVDMVAEGT